MPAAGGRTTSAARPASVTTGARELYVYYRIAVADATQALAAAADAQAALRAAHPGLEARLLRRPQPDGGLETWMEIYTRADGGIDGDVEAAIGAAASRAVAPFLAGARHVEVFVPLVLSRRRRLRP